MAGENIEYTFQIKQHQLDYLEAMCAKHGHPDISKTLRCLVNFAKDEPAQEDGIFKEMRCLEC